MSGRAETGSGSAGNSAGSTALRRLLAGNYRWVICAVLFLVITNNYVDRQIVGVLKTTLQQDRGWDEIDYSNLVFAFQAAYAAGLLFAGRFMDRAGTRIGYAAAMTLWSLSALAHAACSSLFSFGAARAALGLGESGAFPASIKTVSEWFPQKERALATGIFNAGTNIGAILTPLVVPWIVIHLGWRWAFLITGLSGFVCLAAWLLVYREPEKHSWCTERELAYIQEDGKTQDSPVSWPMLLAHRETWAFVAGKFLTDPIWWFYLFWIPGFLQREHGLKLTQIGLPVVVIYVISDIGSVAGGWLSSSLIQRGFSVNAGRKTAMLACALSVVPVAFAWRTHDLWTAVLLIALAAAGHQGFSANLFTLTSDLFPRRVIGSVVGIGGMAGAIGGMLIAKIVGYVLQWTGSYLIPFFIAGCAYLAALGVIHAMSPRLRPARLA